MRHNTCSDQLEPHPENAASCHRLQNPASGTPDTNSCSDHYDRDKYDWSRDARGSCHIASELGRPYTRCARRYLTIIRPQFLWPVNFHEFEVAPDAKCFQAHFPDKNDGRFVPSKSCNKGCKPIELKMSSAALKNLPVHRLQFPAAIVRDNFHRTGILRVNHQDIFPGESAFQFTAGASVCRKFRIRNHTDPIRRDGGETLARIPSEHGGGKCRFPLKKRR